MAKKISKLNNFKLEIANELGITNYDSVDKGSLSSKVNGNIGGLMVKKMIQFAKENMK